jgi:hypothetical protein
MRLNQLKKLVQETVRAEQRKGSSKTRSKTNDRNWNSLVESAVKSVLAEAEGDTEEPAAKESSSSSEFNAIVQNATKLGEVDPKKAKALLQLDNPNKEDAIKVVVGASGTCKKLLPSQNAMNLGKAMHFALGMLNGTMYGSGGPGGDLGAFMCGGYLLDGHHRWISTCMVSPGSSVKGYDMTGIKPGDAVRVLNVATGAVQGHNKGKSGTGSFDPFTSPADLLESLKSKDAGDVTKDKDGETETSTSVPGLSGEGNATKLCEKWANGDIKTNVSPKQWEASSNFPELPVGEKALEWAAVTMAANCKQCNGVKNSAVLPIGNSRIDMPVADDPSHGGGTPAPGFGDKKKDGLKLADTLSKGGLDLKGELPPELQEESIDIRRWNKLAGLLKD